MSEAKKTLGSVSFEYGDKGARCVHRESGTIGPWVSMDKPYHEIIDAMKDTAEYLSWEKGKNTMSNTPQERARAIVKAYLALHDALRNAASEVPLPEPEEATTATHLGAKQEYALYNNLIERFVEHLKNDSYWNLTRIAIGGDND